MAVPISTHIFRFAGGFSITELLMPNGSALFDPIPASVTPAAKSNSSIPGVNAVKSWWGGGEPNKRKAVLPTTLEQDVVRYSQGYRWFAVGAATALVFCGGNGAILGAVASIAFSGESGKERYIYVKRWINERA